MGASSSTAGSRAAGRTIVSWLALALVALLCPGAGAAAGAAGDAGDVGRKRISLSFDDAPRGAGPVFSGTVRTDRLLAGLADAETGPVVFFVTTRRLPRPKSRARIERYAAAGHLIANHSHKHRHAHSTKASTYLADIDRAERHLRGLPNRRPWFRFPYLDEGREPRKRSAIRAGLERRGLGDGYVTVDTFDWYLERRWQEALAGGARVDREALRAVYVALVVEAAEFYDRRAVAALGRRPAQILLLHENDLAATFIVDVVQGLRAKGWEIIDPDTAYGDPIAQQTPKTTFSWRGRVAALAVDGGMRASEFEHPSADREAIDARLERERVFRR